MITAMFTQLAPKASTPPSPKNSAWISKAVLTAMTAAHGPSSTATSTRADRVRRGAVGDRHVEHHHEEEYAAPIASSGT